MAPAPLTVRPCHVARAADGLDALAVHAEGPGWLVGLGRVRRVRGTWDATVLMAGLPDAFTVWLLGRRGIHRARVNLPPRLALSVPPAPGVRVPRGPGPFVMPRGTVDVPSVSVAITPLPPTVP